ncbi:dihydrolipoyllysine-residue succinyltransferase component of 2-oxoglutarate dehydrogenase complex [Rhodopirellula bahusiensis]|uniref:Uncharacterized protein n=1 Tax=Rhodopirellula bahusiensis TaxID=2014065 RepID=A0A2G1W0M0_9BACT|nr:hypothetical protein [Rhodopirellula bahusiensis]PHQ32400.1 hypothetical protein CEE69_25850 [Rhodopirellula bahusiensis]
MSDFRRTSCVPMFASVFCVGLLSILAGCSQEAPIVTYQVPTKMPAVLAAEDTRTIAAILPQKDQAWFFKIMGRESAVDSIDDTFREFVENVEFEDGKPNLDSVPADWRKGADRTMRFASYDINTPVQQLDLSVSQLSRMDDWSDFVVMNVNRWRKQVGLSESQKEWAAAETMTWSGADSEEFADVPAIWVDVTGSASDAGPPMMAGGAPFASMAGGPMTGGASNAAPASDPHAGLPRDAQEAIEQAKASGASMPAAKEKAFPKESASDNAPKSDPALDFDRPEGWRDGRMSMMRMAAFNAGPEEASAEITVISAGGDLRGNVARWMGQVDGGQPDDADVDQALESAEKLTVAGRDAQRFILHPKDKSDDNQASSIDATIVPLENDFSLFIKMVGPAEVIADQDEAMRSFLKSLKY